MSMEMEKVTKFNVAEYLDIDEYKTLYLDEVAKDNHVALSSYRYSSKGEMNRKQWILSREGCIKLSLQTVIQPFQQAARF